MKNFVIEREIPGAGSWDAEQMRGVAGASCDVLRAMGPQIQWVTSYVTADKVFCVYRADSEEEVREHARRGGFPADAVREVLGTLDPTLA